jgi:hypothetical protein
VITTEEFYEAFQEAGMLRPAVWSPSWGAAPQEAQVRYRAPSSDAFGGDQFSVDYTMRYAASAFVGLKRLEPITIVTPNGSENFVVREDPESRGDGSEREAKLSKV